MKDRGRLARAFLATTATLSILVSGVGAYGYVAFNEAQGAIGHFGDPPGTSTTPEPLRDYGPCANDVCNYLILGSDSRAGLSHAQQVANGSNADIGGSNRSDVIILVHTDPSSDTYAGTWHEQLGLTFLGLSAATNSLDGGTDYAFGGATTNNLTCQNRER